MKGRVVWGCSVLGMMVLLSSCSLMQPIKAPPVQTYTISDMSHKRFAVSVILGCNLSALGPGASAAKSCIPPIPNNGKIATASTIIPIPPIQCVKLRQNKTPSGIVAWDHAHLTEASSKYIIDKHKAFLLSVLQSFDEPKLGDVK